MAQDFVPNPRTDATVIEDQFGTEDYNSDRVKVDMRKKIVSYMPSATPFTVLTTRAKKDKRQVYNHDFKWLEDDVYPRDVELTAAALAADVTLDVTAGEEAKVAANYVLLNTRTREHVLVTSTASGVLTVTRGVDGGSQHDMDAGDVLVFTRPVFEEGADIGDARMIQTATKYNYCETIRTPIDYTRRASKIGLHGGEKGPAWMRRKMAMEHAKSIEMAMLFGQRNSISGTAHNRTFMGGLEYYIDSNVWDLSGTGHLDERSFDEMLEEGFRWGMGGKAGKKFLLASSRLLTEINWFAKDKVEYVPLGKTIGFGAMKYLSPHGELFIVKTPLLDDNHPGWGFIVDFNHVRHVHFADDDTHLLKDRGGNGVDGTKDEYLSDVGLEVSLEAAHVLIKGLD